MTEDDSPDVLDQLGYTMAVEIVENVTPEIRRFINALAYVVLHKSHNDETPIMLRTGPIEMLVLLKDEVHSEPDDDDIALLN
jgi:hypothetical protein